ncbi:MAG: hypothetical protein QOJ50_3880 [Cryptosporangiaceae bacterium]|nr:hypothetical protein [Cryptosporangiaceae bacterium]
MLRHRLATLALSGVLVPLAIFTAAPAQAATASATAGATPKAATTKAVTTQDTSCAGGDLCFWQDDDKGGAKGRVSGNNSAWSWSRSGCPDGTWNNCASSIQNNGNSCSVKVYDNAGYSGAVLTLTRGTYISSLSGYWITFPVDSWNDDIQSNKWC